LDKETSTFYEHVVNLAFGVGGVPAGHEVAMKRTMSRVIELLQDTIGILDFWNNPAEQRRLRGALADALLMADIPQVSAAYERLAVEIAKLAKNRHDELMRSRQA